MFWIVISFLQTLLAPLGVYILLNLDDTAERFFILSKARSRSGMVTSISWNKKILMPISLTMIVYGLLNFLVLLQEIKELL